MKKREERRGEGKGGYGKKREERKGGYEKKR